ncbi:MAG: dihydrofolate reductase family protein [Actinobacteria bacterium]|nr:dihydrofolate reductase family protein [Actinomycetota bacterium]
MGRVIFDISMSLDGYIVAPGQTPQQPLGEGGERLHEWAFGGDDSSLELLRKASATLGAVVTGRTNFEHALPWWGPDGPTGSARKPVVVLTHQPPSALPPGSVYTFVTDGPRAALAAARERAGEDDISVMGGADVGRQFLAEGLVDEISLHIAPLVFGGGLRMFDELPIRRDLTLMDCLGTGSAVHLRYRVDH